MKNYLKNFTQKKKMKSIGNADNFFSAPEGQYFCIKSNADPEYHWLVSSPELADQFVNLLNNH